MPVAECFLLLTDVGPQGGAIVLNQITLRYVCLLPPVASRFVVLRSVTVSIVCTTGLRDVLVVRTYLVGLRRGARPHKAGCVRLHVGYSGVGRLKFHDVGGNNWNLVLWTVCHEFYSSYQRT